MQLQHGHVLLQGAESWRMLVQSIATAAAILTHPLTTLGYAEVAYERGGIVAPDGVRSLCRKQGVEVEVGGVGGGLGARIGQVALRLHMH